MKLKKLKPVASLADLKTLVTLDPRYARLAVVAAQNLGGQVNDGELQKALRWLDLNASETSEEGVVGEVNFVRDLVK